MPLGAFDRFPYQHYETDLARDDTVLLMTDGFPEQFNSDREMLGLARTQAFYREVAAQSPEAIIAHLREAGAAWGNGQPPEADVTFVVLKRRAV